MQLYRVKSKTRIPFRDCGNISNLKNNFMSKVLKYTKMYYEPPLQPKVFMDQAKFYWKLLLCCIRMKCLRPEADQLLDPLRVRPVPAWLETVKADQQREGSRQPSPIAELVNTSIAKLF